MRVLRKLTRAVVLAALSAQLGACASAPGGLLRHQMADPLGVGRVRASASLDGSRQFPVVDSTTLASIGTQTSSVFRGWALGLTGTAGVTPSADFNFGTQFSSNSAGWRLGGKYFVARLGSVAVGVLANYGKSSGTGTLGITTTGGTSDVKQTLSVRQIDLGVPLTWRYGPNVAITGSFNFYNFQYEGAASTTAVSGTVNDYGFNLGARVAVAPRVDIEGEFALVKVGGPQASGLGLVTYYGIAGGLSF